MPPRKRAGANSSACSSRQRSKATRLVDVSTSSSTHLRVSALLPKLARLLMVVAIVSASGGHWAVVQSVAWTRMLVEDASGSSLAQAIQKTFDGQHPCDLCKSIASAKAKEKRQTFGASDAAKLLLFFQPSAVTILRYQPTAWQAVRSDAVGQWREAPEAPPPRIGLS